MTILWLNQAVLTPTINAESRSPQRFAAHALAVA
jgi:hypothetical protein